MNSVVKRDVWKIGEKVKLSRCDWKKEKRTIEEKYIEIIIHSTILGNKFVYYFVKFVRN